MVPQQVPSWPSQDAPGRAGLVMVSLALRILGTHRDRESQLVVEAESQSPMKVG